MDKIVLAERYLVNMKEIPKSKTTYTSVEEIETYLKAEMEKHPVASYISTFDHHAHTSNLDGMIPRDILGAINVMCCFGMAIPNAAFMAIKPMSIAVVEKDESFVLSFIEAPAPSAQQAMETWIAAVENI